jgi:hypothetical protein
MPSHQVSTVYLYGVRIVSLTMDGNQRLCLAQISNTLLKDYSYNEIHNRRVALGITCVQCTPVQVGSRLFTTYLTVSLSNASLYVLFEKTRTSTVHSVLTHGGFKAIGVSFTAQILYFLL